jgi:phosphoribosylformylglycinamidine cyclo-ligase
MPGMYPAGEYDLAGFCVGVVEKARILDGKSIQPGDSLLGLASSGPHSNGYSLIRKILSLAEPPSMEALFQPTRIYVKSILELLGSVPVKGLAHITGGGLTGNVPRILQDGLRANIRQSSWPRPAVFQWLQRAGNVAEDEMHRVFNCGIGMVAVVAANDAKRAMDNLRASGETVYEIGVIEKGPGGEADCVVI